MSIALNIPVITDGMIRGRSVCLFGSSTWGEANRVREVVRYLHAFGVASVYLPFDVKPRTPIGVSLWAYDTCQALKVPVHTKPLEWMKHGRQAISPERQRLSDLIGAADLSICFLDDSVKLLDKRTAFGLFAARTVGKLAYLFTIRETRTVDDILAQVIPVLPKGLAREA